MFDKIFSDAFLDIEMKLEEYTRQKEKQFQRLWNWEASW